MESKYYSYFIPENSYSLLNNFKEILKNEELSQNEYLDLLEKIQANILLNDWVVIGDENFRINNFSLVLVKFTSVNDIFFKNINSHSENNIILSKYNKIASNQDLYRKKYANKDYSPYKLKNIIFSGTQNKNYDINSSTEYVFVETIFIPLQDIFDKFPSIIFDGYGENNFEKHLEKYIKKNELTNTKVINILKLTNEILKKVKYPVPHTNYTHLAYYIPLIDTEIETETETDTTVTPKSLWNQITDTYQIHNDPDNPYEFLNNHRLVVCNNNITFSEKQNIKNINFTINCNIFSKVLITQKPFSSINYKDALPFRTFFTVKELSLDSFDSKHNIILDQIINKERKILCLEKQNLRAKQSLKNQNNEIIAIITTDIEHLKTKLKTIDNCYKDHILFHTNVGFRLDLQNYLNSYKSLIYMRYVCNNKEKLNKSFMFNYVASQSNNDDIISMYVDKQLVKDLFNLKIKPDLFTLSRFFNITEENKYHDESYNIPNIKLNMNTKLIQSSNNQSNESNNQSNSLTKLNNFLENNISLSLFEYQKNNVLWMLKIEDEIDNSKLTVNSFIGKFKLNYDHIEDIRSYIHNIKANVPEAILKNYIVSFSRETGEKHIIDIREDATIAQSASILSILNAENNRYDNHNFDFDFDIIESILPKDEYLQKHSKQIQLCGGAICDEVGLGKTLSIISHLVVKMKNDMEKYTKYLNKMDKLVVQLKSKINNPINPANPTNINFIDPIDEGFEYNNLIIVPSRLTSQWESEIVKYVKDKFNLRAKVLVSISNIKILEKELHDFYSKKQESKEKQEKQVNKEKISIKKQSKTNVKEEVTKNNSNIQEQSVQPIYEQSNIISNIINNTNISGLDIDNIIKDDIKDEIKDDITDVNINENTVIPSSKKTKQQKMIDKLMLNAKKNNEKLNKKNNEKISKLNKLNITFDNIIEDNFIIENVTENVTENVSENVTENVTENLSVKDEYEFINKYFVNDNANDNTNDKETEKTYKDNQLYDIYIVSINLLSNDNYLNHILHNTANHLSPHYDGVSDNEINANKIKKIINSHKSPQQICRITDKFNIFRIKWNRVILDEAHEKLTAVVKMFSTSMKKYKNSSTKVHYEDQFLYENLCVINSNYKWAITGTPSENGIDNIMGILQFLTKKNYIESFLEKMEKVRYLSDIIGITNNNLNTLLGYIFKKTCKKDVKTLLNIPIFGEKVIYVDQTNIERNIYNTIRCSRHFTEAVRMRRLFLMCTNILINEGYDFDGEHEIKTEILTLEQLNANMIDKFNQQLKQLDNNEKTMYDTITRLERHTEQWVGLQDYIINLNLDSQINPIILTDLKSKFEDIDRPMIRYQCEIFYSIINIFEIWRNYHDVGNILMSNVNIMKDKLQRLWNTVWETEVILTKCAEYGSKIGINKSKEEIIKKQKALETIINDKKRVNNQIALFSNNEFLKEKTSDPCIICFEDLKNIVVTPCRHVFCLECTKRISNDMKSNFTCPECRTPIHCNSLNITTVDMINKKSDSKKEETVINHSKTNTEINLALTPIENKLGTDWKTKCINKYGSKMATLVEYLYKLFESKENRVIIFSQYDKMLRMIGKTLEEYAIKFVYCCGNNYVLNKNINKFKKDESIRVIMLSSESSNSGSNLTEANYIIFIDVLFENIEKVKAVEAQAIGRSVRLGQKLPVTVVRFVTKGTVEEECFNKNRYDLNILQN